MRRRGKSLKIKTMAEEPDNGMAQTEGTFGAPRERPSVQTDTAATIVERAKFGVEGDKSRLERVPDLNAEFS